MSKSRKNSYRIMAYYHSGLNAFTTMITVVVILAGSTFISMKWILLGDLLTYLLYINNLTEPVKKLINFTEQFQEGITGFQRFMEIMEVEPDIQDQPHASVLTHVQGAVDFEDVGF